MNVNANSVTDFAGAAAQAPLFLDSARGVRGAVADFKGRFFQGLSFDLQGIARDVAEDISPNDPDNPSFDAFKLAIQKMAARAEFVHGKPAGQQIPNFYHHTPHTGDVSVLTHYIARSLSKKDRLLMQVVAFAHDVDHGGRVNPIEKPFGNEERSFAVLEPVMREAGLNDECDIEAAKLMMFVSSPDGGAQYAKAVAMALKKGEEPDHDAIVDRVWGQVKGKNGDAQKAAWAKEMDKLKPLATSRQDVLKPALLLHAADILPSILEAQINSIALSMEKNNEAIDRRSDEVFDFTQPGATLFFLENLVTRELFELYPELEEFLPFFDEAFLNAYESQMHDIYPRIMEPEEP